jgi:hypothetical protein
VPVRGPAGAGENRRARGEIGGADGALEREKTSLSNAQKLKRAKRGRALNSPTPSAAARAPEYWPMAGPELEEAQRYRGQETPARWRRRYNHYVAQVVSR